jgi:hypothetical protein
MASASVKSDVSGTESPGAARRSRKRDFIELSVAYALLLLVLWTPLPWQRLFYWSTLAWVLLTTCISFDGWKAMGFHISGLLRSLWIVGAALLAASVTIAFAVKLHTLHSPQSLGAFIKALWGYALWAFLQQFLLQDFFLLRLLRLLPNRNAALIAAVGLFTLAHLPNPVLTLMTLLWGFVACLVFLHYRNLYPLALAHAILGICIAISVPGHVDHNMRVGLGYLRYRPHAHNHLSQNDHIVSTDACVMAEAPTRRS